MGNGEHSYEYDVATPFTDIIFPHARQLTRLAFKLEDYRERHGGDPTIPCIWGDDFAAYGVDHLKSLFRLHVLKAVIELGSLAGRDTLVNPITMGEVAARFRANTGLDVSHAVSGPKAILFGYSQELNWHMPIFAREDDHASPYPRETDDFGTLFIGAYCVARAYAWDRRDLVPAERWLVELPYLPDIPEQQVEEHT